MDIDQRKKYHWIRTFYLYLFSIVGLVLMIIGVVNFIDMGMKAFIFTTVEKRDALNYNQPPYSFPSVINDEKMRTEIISGSTAKVELTADEYTQLKYALIEYKNWQERNSDIDYVRANREQRASINLALIIVGIPLYLYHWLTIRKEKEKL